MAKARTPTATRATRPPFPIIDIVVLTLVALIPLLVLPGADSFRQPKMFLLIFGGFLLIVLTFRGREWQRFLSFLKSDRRVLILIAVIVGWTATTTVLSSQRALSLHSLVIVVATSALFCWCVITIRSRSTAMLWVLLAPAAINACVVIAQRLGHNPFTIAPDVPTQLNNSALVGNPDDVCTYLAATALAATVLAAVDRRQRVPAACAAALMLAGMFATNSLTGMLAYLIGALASALLLSWRKGLLLLFLTSVVFILAAVAWRPLNNRISNIRAAMAAQRYDTMLSGRLTPTLAALSMVADNPLLGVGPGCYAFHFFEHKLRVEKRWPELLGTTPLNFGEAHNDHAQVMAEVGVIGYVIMLVAVILLALRRAVLPGELSAEATFARVAAPSIAAAFLVAAAAQFPLRLAATLIAYLFVAATTVAWSRAAE
jgi:O-antigen ligase